jgi:S1-C subfamily serine protease
VPEKTDLELLKTGELVFAVGSAPDSNKLTINQGVISAFGRLDCNAIQTDARLNYGNTGGALCDKEGKFIGMNFWVTLANAYVYGQNSGVGFTLPWKQIEKILPKLKEGEKIKRKKIAFLGIQMDVTFTDEGVRILEVVENSAAERSGLKAGDIIIKFDGKRIKYFTQLRKEILRRKPGDKVKITVIRDDEEKEFKVRLGEKFYRGAR